MTDSINITGAKAIKAKLAFMTDPQGVTAGFKNAADHVIKVAEKYPPKPPQSKYKRTGHLGRLWRKNFTSLVAHITNDTKYGPYVQGEKQTIGHAITGWKTTEEIAASEAEAVTEIVMKAVEKVLNK